MSHPATIFEDGEGRSWACTVTSNEVLEAQRLLGVDLLSLTSNPEQTVALSAAMKAEVLLLVLSDQMKERGVTVSQLLKALPRTRGLTDAYEALLSGVMEFRDTPTEVLDQLWKARQQLRKAQVP